MIPFSAIDLQILQAIYETDLLPYMFCYQIKDGKRIKLAFEQSQLSHLLGIQRVDQSRTYLQGQRCYNEIKNGNLTFEKLKSINRSAVANYCKDKMRYFDELPSLLIAPDCVLYDVSFSARPTNIKMSIALYGDNCKASHRLILGIDHSKKTAEEKRNIHEQVYFPRTWLIERLGSKSILDNQAVLQIEHIERKNRSE